MTRYHLYFAFGSNLNDQQMIARCPSAIEIATGSLCGYRLAFAGWSHGWAGGVADIRRAKKSDKVRGVIWEISGSDLKALDLREGRPYQYDRKLMTIVSKHGNRIKAWVYYLASNQAEARCSMAYYAQIADAYQTHGFSLQRLTTAMLRAPVRLAPARKQRRRLQIVGEAWEQWLTDENKIDGIG